jgi:hypothetical protein
MSIITNYKCDRCGNIQYSSEQFWKVELKLTCNNQTYNSHLSPLELCRNCLDSLQILKPLVISNLPPEVKKPTVEELIKEIITLVNINE